MYLRMGNLGTHLITSPSTEWRTYIDSELVAIVTKAEWANEEVDFSTREAGEILLDQYKTVFAAQVKDGPVEEKDDNEDEKKDDNSEAPPKKDEKPTEEDAIVDVGPAEAPVEPPADGAETTPPPQGGDKPAPKSEPSMVKSDEGVTKDVPPMATTLPPAAPGPDDHSPQAMGTDIGDASPDEVSSDDIPGQFADLVHQLTTLVEQLHEGTKNSAGSSGPMIDEMHSVAQQFKAKRLMYIAEKELSAGLDCSATLDELDKVTAAIKPVKMDDIHEVDDEKIKPLEDITALLQAADRLASQGVDVSDIIEQLAYDDGTEGQDEQDKQLKGKVYKKMLGKGEGEDEEDRRPFKEAALNKAASSNRKCALCGQSTDSHAAGCASNLNVQDAAHNYTKQGKPRKIGPSTTKAPAPLHSKADLSKTASHIEIVDIPMKDIEMDPDKDYNLYENYQLDKVLHTYLKLFVYQTMGNFSVESTDREGDTLKVKVLVFDNQIDH